MNDALNASVKKIIAKGKERGYLTYEEMNEGLPDEAVSPDKLDSLLMTLDELGIELLDESEVDRRETFSDGEEEEQEIPGKKASAKPSQEELDAVTKRIDDPVRMYLTQMGEIPLLTRLEEINLAK